MNQPESNTRLRGPLVWLARAVWLAVFLIVAGMVAAGTIEPDEIYTHPQRSVIYRSIGDRPSVEVDLSTLALCPDDRLVLCCDGLWEMIRNEGIEDILLRESDPQMACEIMVEQANRAGGSDNISVIIVQL